MPQVFNQTAYAVHVVPLIDRDGRTVAVVIAKGTYQIDPRKGLVPAAEQEAIVFVDEFVGEPGKSDIRIPSDLIDYKPATDVVVVRPAVELDQSPIYGRRVSLQVGPVQMSGRIGKNWEFGPLRRDEKPRRGYAGTYDQAWVESRMPLLPKDFDPRHNQVAPPSQIAPGYLTGSESFKLSNLYSDGKTNEGTLPGRVVIVSGNVLNHYFTNVAVIDTVLIWADTPKMVLVWRSVIRPKQKFEEVSNVHVYLVRLHTARELYGAP